MTCASALTEYLYGWGIQCKFSVIAMIIILKTLVFIHAGCNLIRVSQYAIFQIYH